MPKFQFSGGWRYCQQVKTENTQSAKICLNFNFRMGGGGVCSESGALSEFRTKFSTTPASSCITDSLSHTTYVETNKTRYCSQDFEAAFNILGTDKVS